MYDNYCSDAKNDTSLISEPAQFSILSKQQIIWVAFKSTTGPCTLYLFFFKMIYITLLLHGIAISTNRSGESVLQNAITGMFTYEASVTG